MTTVDARSATGVCDRCLRRTILLAALSPWIERARHGRRHIRELLALDDESLLAAVSGRRRPVPEPADVGAARARVAAAGLAAACGHDPRYPARLRDAADAPAMLHVAGDPWRVWGLTDAAVPAVAVVGARRAGPDALEVARGLGRGLAAAGVTVVSGMALGVDSAAHAGALEVGGPTIAVLAGGADRAYPPSKQHLYRELCRAQAVVSEMPPGCVADRWCFPARNRIIAGLCSLTIVVEAAERSGSLITADLAQQLGRTVGAVPGPVTSARAAGSNALLRDGAAVIRDAQDALDETLGVGVATARGRAADARLEPGLRELLRRVDAGEDTLAGLGSRFEDVESVMVGLAELETRGYLRRGPGGRYLRPV